MVFRPPNSFKCVIFFDIFLDDGIDLVRMKGQKRVTNFFSCSSVGEGPSKNSIKPIFDLELKPLIKKKPKLSVGKSDVEQTIIDAGQKRVGGQYCKQCDMLYSVESVADMKIHEKHHNRYVNIGEVQVRSSQLDSWLRKECHYLSEHGYIFRIRSDSQSSLRPKVEDVIEDFVNTSVGFCVDLSIWGLDKRRTVWVSLFNQGSKYYIAGIAITETLSSAQCSRTGEVISDGDPIIGVNRIWTHPAVRKKGVAREIVDVARRWCFGGVLVPRHRVAFSDPTDDGRLFAKRYIEGSNDTKPLLVYTIAE